MTDELEGFWLERRQGDVLGVAALSVGGSSETIATTQGVAIVSQTCDIVRLGNKPNVVVARVVELESGRDARAAIEGERPRYVHLPAHGSQSFIDLEFVQSFDKSYLQGSFLSRGVNPNDFEAVRKLALAIGRRFSRLALPDEVVPWFDPLTNIAQRQFDNSNSPIGRALSFIREFRVEAPSWDPPGISATLHVIVKEDELQEFNPNAAVSHSLQTWFTRKKRTYSDIADKLFPQDGTRPNHADRDQLWRWLGEALADKCVASAPGGNPAVSEVISQVSSEAEFNLVQYRKSDQLDLAHLSAPTPNLS